MNSYQSLPRWAWSNMTNLRMHPSARWLVRLLISCLLLSLALRSVNLPSLLGAIRFQNVSLLVLAVALFFPGQLLSAWRWHMILAKLGCRDHFGWSSGMFSWVNWLPSSCLGK